MKATLGFMLLLAAVQLATAEKGCVFDLKHVQVPNPPKKLIKCKGLDQKSQTCISKNTRKVVTSLLETIKSQMLHQKHCEICVHNIRNMLCTLLSASSNRKKTVTRNYKGIFEWTIDSTVLVQVFQSCSRSLLVREDELTGVTTFLAQLRSIVQTGLGQEGRVDVHVDYNSSETATSSEKYVKACSSLAKKKSDKEKLQECECHNCAQLCPKKEQSKLKYLIAILLIYFSAVAVAMKSAIDNNRKSS